MILPMYIPGQWEIIIVVFGILVLFGGKKIPEMMKGIGTGIKEFKKGVREENSETKTIPDDEKKAE